MQAYRQTNKQTGRKAGRQEVRQTDTQTRVPIKLGLVDVNDLTTTYINTSVDIRP